MIKVSASKTYIAFINIYALNNRTPNTWNRNYRIKGKIRYFSISNWKLNILLLILDQTIRQDINKEREDLHNTANQLDLKDIYTIVHLTTAK